MSMLSDVLDSTYPYEFELAAPPPVPEDTPCVCANPPLGLLDPLGMTCLRSSCFFFIIFFCLR